MTPYYYILASLPDLLFERPPALSNDELLALSRPWLRSHEILQLRMARIDIENVSPERLTNAALRRWYAFENTLRNELVKWRAGNLNVTADPHLRPEDPYDGSAVRLARQAIDDRSPLRAEMNLLRTRWAFLDREAEGHPFDLTALIVYGLKLQLLIRRHRFDAAEGRRVLERIYGQNLHGTNEDR
jgi:hypothetical protein